jgi:hypothetical protein
MKKLALIAPLAALSALAVAVGRSKRSALKFEVIKHSHLGHFEEHSHEAVVHAHEHPHVTHNRRQGADEVLGEWEHLTSVHTHEHNHAAVAHAHLPHENAEHEHLGEAHIHDHSHPTAS